MDKAGMGKALRVLIVEDNPDDAELVLRELRRAGFDPDWQRVETEEEYLARLSPDLDLILSDYSMPQFDGMHALELLQKRGLEVPFILISGTIGEDTAVNAVKQGAADYLLKDRLMRLGAAVRHALEESRLRRERKRAAEELTLFRTLVDQSDDTFEVVDPATARFLDVNEKGCLDLGYSRAGFLALRVFDVDPLVTESDWPQVLEQLRATGFLIREGLHRRADGSTFHVELRAKLVRLDRDYIVAVVRDITERKLSETRLREQAEMLDRAHDAIIARDMITREITFWNKGAEELYGWTAWEAVGRDIGKLIFVDAGDVDAINEILLKNGEWNGESHQVSKTGREIIVNGRATLMRDGEEARPKIVLTINTDITEQKKFEVQFLRAQRLESIGTLASGVAHDLNNILSPILMSAPLLREPMPKDMRDTLLSTIEVSAQRGADIVKQVLTFARGIEGERVNVQPVHLLKEVVGIAQETFPRSIHIIGRYPNAVWTIDADPTQIHQVLLNLCVNARDAMPSGGTMTLSIENCTFDENYASMIPYARAGCYICMQASDTGAGIRREILDRIFEPFFTTKEIGKGTGLGLSTVLGIVKSHGGFVTVESELNRGSTFKVFLPANPNGQVASAEIAGAKMPNARGETVLIVDDEPSILDVCRRTLEKQGYHVLTAGDGTEALAIFAKQMDKIQVVLTDIIMPYMDGATLVRTLRKMKPDVKIIASTGQPEMSHSDDLKEIGVSTFLPKPYNTKSLLKTLHDLIHEKAVA